MNRKNKFLAHIAFYTLAAGLLAYAASRTLNFVSQTMPADKQFMGYLFLFSTGLGSIIWLFVLLALAEGARQRGISFAMGVIDLAGELVLVYADTILVASANGALIMTAADLQLFILASVGIMGLNLVAAYFFKLFDPAAEAAAQARDLSDEVIDAAIKELNTPAARQRMIHDLLPVYRRSVADQVRSEVHAAAGRFNGRHKEVESDPDLLFQENSD